MNALMFPFKNCLLIALISFGLVHSGRAETTNGIMVKNGERIAFLGDSITSNGWAHTDGYVRLVAAGLKSVGVEVVPVPAGVGGNTSADILGRIDRDVIGRKPDWMTLSCGVNDVWHGPTGCDLEAYKSNVTSIVDKAQAAGIKVMILTATGIYEDENNKFNKELVHYNDFLRQFAKARNLLLADVSSGFWDAVRTGASASGTEVRSNVITVDGVHMTPDGNMVMARGVLEAFGLSPAQVGKFEATWRNSPNAVSTVGTLILSGSTGVSVNTYHAIIAAARAQNIKPEILQNDLCFQALRVVLRAHEREETLRYSQIQDELKKAFAQQVEVFEKSTRNH